MLRDNAATRLLQTLPGVGRILSKVLALEIGAVERFPSAEDLTSYAGLVPRAYNSGGHCRQGHCGRDVNHYLKWAYVEAASVLVRQQHRRVGTHVIRLYQRVRRRTDSYGKGGGGASSGRGHLLDVEATAGIPGTGWSAVPGPPRGLPSMPG